MPSATNAAVFTCEDPPADFDCAQGVKMAFNGVTTVRCTSCPNGKVLDPISGKCTGTNGPSIANCEAVVAANQCFKCKGNIATSDPVASCPDPAKDCLKESGSDCLFCNVEAGKSAYDAKEKGVQKCFSRVLGVSWMVLIVLLGFW